jgi:hypothetical protein
MKVAEEGAVAEAEGGADFVAQGEDVEDVTSMAPPVTLLVGILLTVVLE